MTKNLGCFLDKTYCASPNCINACGCKASPEVEEAIAKAKYSRVAYAYFCGGEPTDSKTFTETLKAATERYKNTLDRMADK